MLPKFYCMFLKILASLNMLSFCVPISTLLDGKSAKGFFQDYKNVATKT